jgi:hypothetical protein
VPGNIKVWKQHAKKCRHEAPSVSYHVISTLRVCQEARGALHLHMSSSPVLSWSSIPFLQLWALEGALAWSRSRAGSSTSEGVEHRSIAMVNPSGGFGLPRGSSMFVCVSRLLPVVRKDTRQHPAFGLRRAGYSGRRGAGRFPAGKSRIFGSEFGPWDPFSCIGLVLLCILVVFSAPELDSRPVS